jgi:ferredoxin
MRVRVRVDEDLCMGVGNCLHLARGTFVLNDEGIAEVVEGAGASEEELRLAARSCPTSAIVIEGDGGT